MVSECNIDNTIIYNLATVCTTVIIITVHPQSVTKPLNLSVLDLDVLDIDGLKVHLLSKDTTLLSGSVTTDKSSLTVEVLGNLLKRSVLGLDVEEPDNDKLNGQPAAVDDVVLPSNGVEGDWVDVLVEEERNVDHQEHESHTLGTEVVWENLASVTDEETRPGHVVEGVVDEDHDNDTSGGTLGALLGKDGGADGPDDEACEHTAGGDQEKSAATDLVNEEALTDGDDGVTDLEDTVDDELSVGVGNTDLVEDDVDVVGNETVTRPLGEETSGQENDQTVTVTLGADELLPAVTLELGLHLESVLDLLKLENNDLVVEVTVGVDVRENLVGTLLVTLADVPSWRLWNEPDEAELEEGWESLNDGWDSPGPVVVDLVGTESQPGGDDGTDVPGGVVNGGEGGTVLRVGELSDKEWGSTVGDGDTETDEETSGDEHLEVDGDGLENDTDKPVGLLGLCWYEQ